MPIPVRRKVAGKHGLQVKKHRVLKAIDRVVGHGDVMRVHFGLSHHAGAKLSERTIKLKDPDDRGVIKATVEASGFVQEIFIIPKPGADPDRLKADLESVLAKV